MGKFMLGLKSRFKGTPIGKYLRRRNWNKSILSEKNAEETVELFMNDISEAEKNEIVQDIIYMAKNYRFSAEEYFAYRFKDKSLEERKTFLSDLNRIDFVENLNKYKNLILFDDKMRSYETFGKYYKRDVCCIRNKNELHKLDEFVKKYERFILKPLTGACGLGVQIIDLTEIEEKTMYLNKLMDDVLSSSKDGFIVEELIIQVPELAQFHTESVNTIRVATVRYDEGVEVIAAFFRMGKGSSIVDNAGAGGVFGAIDVETGKIIAASDKFGKAYTHHPDTNVQITGFIIPQFDEAKELAKELALIVKGNRYAGWDLALTEKGWIMVEGNARGQFVWQIPTQKGFMKEANQILKRLKMKEMTDLSI